MEMLVEDEPFLPGSAEEARRWVLSLKELVSVPEIFPGHISAQMAQGAV